MKNLIKSRLIETKAKAKNVLQQYPIIFIYKDDQEESLYIINLKFPQINSVLSEKNINSALLICDIEDVGGCTIPLYKDSLLKIVSNFLRSYKRMYVYCDFDSKGFFEINKSKKRK